MACWATDELSFDPAQISEQDLAYLAGLFDGEGCVVVLCNRRAGLVLGMNDASTIRWLEARFGGRVTRSMRHPEFHRWELRRVADLTWLLPRLAPRTICKRRRLEAALALVEHTRQRPGLKARQLEEWKVRLPELVAPLRAGYWKTATEQR